MRRCTLTDKKAIAIIISCAMLASTFYMGPVFADEGAGASEEAPITENTQAETELQMEPADASDEDTAVMPEDGTGTEAGNELVEEQTEPAAEPNAEEQDASEVSTMALTPAKQPVRVVVVWSAKNRVLLKPDSYGNYTLKSSITKIRGSKKIKIMISNPAECPLTYSSQKVASNTNGSFLETELAGYSVNEPETIKEMSDAVAAAGMKMNEAEPILNKPETVTEEPDPEEPGSEEPGSGEPGSEEPGSGEPGNEPDPGQEEPVIGPEDLQVTEVTVKVNGTGEASFSFNTQAGEDYNAAKGKITITQTRPTSVLSRTAKVKTKAGKPKTVPRKYKEKYFIIVNEGENQKAVYKFKTVTQAFELKRASGISESGYRANQGGGSDGTYSYHALCKKGSKTYAKIIKTRLRDMKVVKVSKDLKLHHANDITYDPVNKRLVVTHNTVKRKRVTFINPKTLKSMGHKDIKIPATLKGATKKQMSAVKGFASVTYMTDGKYAGKYLAVISGNHNFLVLNKNFTPIEYITVNSKINGSQIYYQGADNMGGKLYVAVYPRKKSRRDFIVAYDMDGNFLGKVNLIKGYEVENVFHAGNTQYVTLYKKVKKTWYTPKVVKKKVKLTKKERQLAKPDKKGKKPKYKKVIKIVKEKHTKSVKRSFVYRMKKVTL